MVFNQEVVNFVAKCYKLMTAYYKLYIDAT